MSSISHLLSKLEDPFEIFPLQSVARHLTDGVGKHDESTAERSGWWGVSAKYRTVEMEHDYEVITILMGSAFVLGQTAITQAVSIVMKIYELANNPSWLPACKAEILRLEANTNAHAGLSEIVLIDAVANYFKHRHEWPDGWNCGTVQNQQSQTIANVQRLGLSPDSESNFETATRNLGFRHPGCEALADAIQSWRERLAENLRTRLQAHDMV